MGQLGLACLPGSPDCLRPQSYELGGSLVAWALLRGPTLKSVRPCYPRSLGSFPLLRVHSSSYSLLLTASLCDHVSGSNRCDDGVGGRVARRVLPPDSKRPLSSVTLWGGLGGSSSPPRVGRPSGDGPSDFDLGRCDDGVGGRVARRVLPPDSKRPLSSGFAVEVGSGFA